MENCNFWGYFDLFVLEKIRGGGIGKVHSPGKCWRHFGKSCFRYIAISKLEIKQLENKVIYGVHKSVFEL